MSGEKNKTVFLFTAAYPYGIRNEPFLENEIQYLSESFKEVIIFPQTKPDNDHRYLPENVKINDCISNTDLSKKKRLIFTEFFFVLKILLSSAKGFKRIKSFWKNYKLLLDIIAISIAQGKSLEKNLADQDLENVIFYDYWFINATFSIGYLKKKRDVSKFVCRAHRYDIYKESWPTINVPFLEYRLKVVDEIFFIAEHGRKYVSQIINDSYKPKLKLSYLGVKKPSFETEKRKPNQTFTIVSCARVVDFKRVHKIPKVLEKIEYPVKWIHFGDGPLFSELKENCLRLPPNIEVDLRGHVSNKSVHEFYKNNLVDLFLSISLSEGLPVSMMEATGYGVPVFAVHSGGVDEIVNNTTGILLNHDLTLEEISNKLEKFMKENQKDEDEIIDFFDNNFSAKENYRKFILALKC